MLLSPSLCPWPHFFSLSTQPRTSASPFMTPNIPNDDDSQISTLYLETSPQLELCFQRSNSGSLMDVPLAHALRMLTAGAQSSPLKAYLLQHPVFLREWQHHPSSQLSQKQPSSFSHLFLSPFISNHSHSSSYWFTTSVLLCSPVTSLHLWSWYSSGCHHYPVSGWLLSFSGPSTCLLVHSSSFSNLQQIWLLGFVSKIFLLVFHSLQE